MRRFWNAALVAGGIGSIGAFVFWSLYKEWLSLSVFSQLTQQHTFYIMLLFLALTFLSLISMLATYIWIEKRKGSQSNREHMMSNVRLIDASLDRNNQHYSESQNDGHSSIERITKE